MFWAQKIFLRDLGIPEERLLQEDRLPTWLLLLPLVEPATGGPPFPGETGEDLVWEGHRVKDDQGAPQRRCVPRGLSWILREKLAHFGFGLLEVVEAILQVTVLDEQVLNKKVPRQE